MTRRVLDALLVGAGLLLGASTAIAGGGAGEVTHLSGTLSVKRSDGSTKLLSVKSEIQPGDTLSTEQETYARVKFIDGGEVVLRPGSQVKVEAYKYDQAKPQEDNAVISLLKGSLRAVTGLLGKRSREKVAFTTPTATIGIRGTNFGVCESGCGDAAPGLHVDVSDGAVVVKNSAGELVVNTGQFAYVKSGTDAPILVVGGHKIELPKDIGGVKGCKS